MLSSKVLGLTAALLPAAWAFHGSAPLLAWTSSDRPELFAVQYSNTRESSLETLLNNAGLCSFDTVMIIAHPGLHANDLRSLPPTSFLSHKLRHTKRSLSLPYTSVHPISDVRGVAEDLSRTCGRSLEWFDLQDELSSAEIKGEKGVYFSTMPTIYGDGAYRRQKVEEMERELSRTISQIEESSPNHIVIYTGTSLLSPDFSKRQFAGSQPFSFANGTRISAVNSDGIFYRYALFSPGLIVALAVVFFLLVPILLVAVRSLASIQNSVRLDAPKGPSLDKKNQ